MLYMFLYLLKILQTVPLMNILEALIVYIIHI